VCPSNAILAPIRDASCRASPSLTEHRRDVALPIEASQPDPAARHEAEEEDQCRVLAWQAALRLHSAPKHHVQPLSRPVSATTTSAPIRT
jgi:hypothetical protein